MSVTWLERHMEMTQGFICVGKNPGLFVFGEPTHDRMDLSEEARNRPDLTRLKAYIVPGGCGIIIKKGTWHDFPVSAGPPVTAFILNTREVVAALAAMKSPAPMNQGDCFKLKLEHHFDEKIYFPDPRPFVVANGFVQDPIPRYLNGHQGYGHDMIRQNLPCWGIDDTLVYVVPVINVEIFTPGAGGPGIQPHLQSQPELANSGWRNYGNNCGLKRLIDMTKKLDINATAVINSDAAENSDIADMLINSGWELGAHGKNNSSNQSKLSIPDETNIFSSCRDTLKKYLFKQPTTWLTPGFSVTKHTPYLAASTGYKVLLDFVDDDYAYDLIHQDSNGVVDNNILCLPYSMETNDFSLVLCRHYSPQQYAATIEAHIEQLTIDNKDNEKSQPKVVCLGLHTFVAGTPANVFELSKSLSRIKNIPGVKFVTADQLSKIVRETK